MRCSKQEHTKRRDWRLENRRQTMMLEPGQDNNKTQVQQGLLCRTNLLIALPSRSHGAGVTSSTPARLAASALVLKAGQLHKYVMAVRGVAGRHRRGVPIARWAQSLHGSGKVSEGPVLLYSWASATANLIHREVTDRSLLRASLGAHAARSTTAAAVMLPPGGAFGEDITTKPRPARLKTGKYGRRKAHSRRASPCRRQSAANEKIIYTSISCNSVAAGGQ